jgi:MinD-like ATPase involved in chromosome partitioning or flagellar assembly
VLAEAVRPLSRTVALVDGELEDPDAWAALSVSGSPPTFAALVSALREGRRPASPGYGGLPSLQVYPDSAGGEGYPPADLHRAADHLRGQHLSVVVDLPPQVPETLDSLSTTRAAWLAEADVAVIVTSADQAGLTEVQRRLQAEVLRGKRIVACLAGTRPRPGRDRPELVALFENLRSHVTRVVEIPDDDAGTVALLQRALIEPARPGILKAYQRYASTVVEVASAP